MVQRTVVKGNLYFDSVTLMRVSATVEDTPGVLSAMVGMGTALNLALLKNMGVEAPQAGPNDLIIGVAAESEAALDDAFAAAEAALFAKAKKTESAAQTFETIGQVAALRDGYNLALISVPGAHAAREAKRALDNDMHVFLFSDNVSIEQEIALKKLACARGLLMMGPDCGTAIINGAPLGFANRVRRGDIGVVGASGTGLQHVTTLIDAFGGGITQAIGTGGRDLKTEVGGAMMLAGLSALREDKSTRVVVIVSKPPAKAVAEKIFEAAGRLGKPVVLCLFGAAQIDGLPEGVTQCFDIEETARRAVERSKGSALPLSEPGDAAAAVEAFLAVRKPSQKYLRGVFGGGTLCDEAMITLRRLGVPIHSNIPLAENEKLDNLEKSQGHTLLDMGDDYFTLGKPHPMIEPALRSDRIVREALDPQTAVMLVDVELGHGSHRDPAGVLLSAHKRAVESLAKEGRAVLWVASVIGTQDDPQNIREQTQKLIDAGFVVRYSNVRAARIAASVAVEGGMPR